MMECDKINPLLTRFLAEELTERERYSVEKHLASCSACSEDLRYLGRIDQTLRRMERTPMPRAVELRILARLPLLTGWEPPMYAVVAAAVFLGVVIGAWSYVINFQLFQPVVDYFRIVNANFWAWVGNQSPDLVHVLNYLTDFTVVHVVIIIAVGGAILYKLGEYVLAGLWGHHALTIPIKQHEKN